jgi:hypothetical protein
VLSVLLVVLRSICRYSKLRRLPVDAEDICIYVAEAAFITSCALLINMMPTTYKLNSVAIGTIVAEHPSNAEIVRTMKEFFATNFMLRITLWAEKLCLLFIFRKFTIGIQSYERAWYAVTAFIIVTFCTLVILQFESCPSMDDFFTPSKCVSASNL